MPSNTTCLDQELENFSLQQIIKSISDTKWQVMRKFNNTNTECFGCFSNIISASTFAILSSGKYGIFWL